MNFFESQERARSYTYVLISLFVIALVILVILANLVLVLAMGVINGRPFESSQSFLERMDWWTFAMVGLCVSLVVLTGSISKIISLKGGGKVIAESLGGQLIQRNTTDAKQRQLLNVVEEMAIASGTPAPPVYLLSEESAINAFAAGYSPRDAIIGVTRGLVNHLNREQLQGVIAHEFSHIFNGDMRLNIQLIGILNGILIIGRVGYEIVSLPFRHRGSGVRYRSSSKNGVGVLAVVLAAGFGLLIIGYTGIFFGNLIKAAVSRQREYLADASAVQFTRNPAGIAGALKKIGGLKAGSRVFASSANDISHAFFATGVSSFMLSLWATHPPLEDRIRRVDPAWDGRFITPDKHHINPVSSTVLRDGAPPTTGPASVTSLAEVNASIDSIGITDHHTIQQARNIMSAIPAFLQHAAQDPWSARALIYALLLDQEYVFRIKQLEHLRHHADREVYLFLQKLIAEVDALPEKIRLPLVDLSLPSLKQLSNRQYQSFRDNVAMLVQIDSKLNLMQWSLQKILFNQLDQVFFNQPQPGTKFTKTRQVYYEVILLLSVMAHTGNQQPGEAKVAFTRAAHQLDFNKVELVPVDQISVVSIDRAVNKIQRLKPTLKQQFLKACATSIMSDRKITSIEAEMFRAFADALDCPISLFDE